MRRGTIFIVLFVLVAGGIIAVSILLGKQPALEITIATDPLSEAWLRDAALSFNQSEAKVGVGRRIRVNVIVRGDTQVLASSWTVADHPQGWVPAWSSIANIAHGAGVTSQVVASSLARTPIVWMSFDSHSAEIPDLSWQSIQAAVGQSANIDLAFSLPTNSVQGLGVLISAIADFQQTGILSDGDISDAALRAWLAPIVESVPNFNTIGADVASFVAGPRGGTVDAAIGPESQWLVALSTLRTKGAPRFAYPAYPVVLDFPFLTLRDSATTDDEVSAAQAFAAFLNSAEQQAKLERYGLRPAQGDPSPEAALFVTGQQYGIAAALPAVQPVQLPTSSGLNSLNQWFNTVNR